MIFTQELYIPFHFIDPARVMFFGRSAELFHQTFETWLLASGKDWTEIFQNPVCAVPIKHFQVDFKRPCFAGVPYTAKLRVAAIHTTSFETIYQLFEGEALAFETKAVHVFIDPKEKRPISIPEDWKAYFAKYLG
jgi:acyl-CoA thioesterase FadM